MRPLPLAIIFVAVILAVCGYVLLFKAEAEDHHGLEKSPLSYEDCLICHEFTSDINTPESEQICVFRKFHPSVLVYPLPDGRDKFKPVGVVKMKGVKFINGKIDCISCHDLSGSNRYYLRFEYGENFCKTCHMR